MLAVPPTYASAVVSSESQDYDDSGLGDLYGAEGGPETVPAEEKAALGGGIQGDASMLCPYMMAKGECRLGESCTYLHGEVCDMCGLAVLHPTDQVLREEHVKVSSFMFVFIFFLHSLT